ncbi:MAG: hypothetical protein OEW19_14020, partial [Acidobacteriota bacterium]|nr:hypothetical protein [Acidobacteriota bacterium]
MRLLLLVAGAAWLALAAVLPAQAPETPEAKAVAYLTRAATDFRSSNDCFSCHASGDAARALFMAANRGHDIGDSLTKTRAFLEAPATWAANKGHEADEELARLQFAAALAAAGDRDLRPAQPLVDAATIILGDQMPDGSWAPDASDGPGSPLTWGTPVATWMARTTLIAAGRQPDDFAVAQTDR